MKLVDLEAFELDQFGRARLSSEDLQLIEDISRVTTAGGDGINSSCSGSNGLCNNDVKCDGSTNSTFCSNSGSCDVSMNKTRCGNTQREVELEP